MPPREFFEVATFAIPLISFTTSVPLIVWLGMILLSSDTLRGLPDKQHEQIQRARRGFARLIFRALLIFVATMPLAGLCFGAFAVRGNPAPGLLVAGIVFSAWWLYVVFGSLAYAWRALDLLHDR